MSVKIEDLKRSIDLVELFGSYGIEVKRKGAQHECCCPFHDGDDSPSLKITPEKGFGIASVARLEAARSILL